MKHIALLATGWGTKYGGVNSFNIDLARALGALSRGTMRVTCFVPRTNEAEREEAARDQVDLQELTGIDSKLDASCAEAVLALIRQRSIAEVDWWIGHDLVTGPLGIRVAALSGGRSAVIHHMSYARYAAYKHEEGEQARVKHEQQVKLFRAADRKLAVGPLLRKSLADLVGRPASEIPMLIPGLAEIDARPMPAQFHAISFGRLDAENDRIKQGRLAVAGFAVACGKAHADGSPEMLLDGRMTAIGIAAAGGEEERSLQALAAERAGRVVPLMPLVFDEDRQRVFEQVASASVALMLSWHEGFGLTGWEAVAAQVPLIVSRNSGLYQFIDDRLAGAGTGCIQAIDTRGALGGDGEENFTDKDTDDVQRAILDVARKADKWKKNARSLFAQLTRGEDACTWKNTALDLLKALGVSVPEVPAAAPSGTPSEAPAAVVASTESKPTSFLELSEPTWRPNSGLAEMQLLRADEECVPFHAARRPLLDEILAWARDDRHPDVALQLRTGPGGAGKTRLLRQACRELRAAGWVTGFAPSGSIDAKQLRALFQRPEHVLVVLDYAETRRPDIAALVEAALAFKRAGVRRRIALLARDGGEWWERLPTEYPKLEAFFVGAGVTGPYPIKPIPADVETRRALFAEAAHAFAERTGRSAANIVIPDLRAPFFEEVLFLHLAAMAALNGERAETAIGLIDTALRRERRYWTRIAADVGLPSENAAAIDQTVGLFTLVGGTRTATDARQLIDATPRLAGVPPAQRAQVFRALRDFYADEGGIDALRPDLLGERIVVQELSRDDSLLDVALQTKVSPTWARGALTVLTFLARRSKTEAVWLERGLDRHLAARAEVAMRVAVEIGDPIGRLLADALARSPEGTKRVVVDSTHNKLPEETLALREFAVEVMRLRVERLRKKDTAGQQHRLLLAEAQNNLGLRLRDVGNLEEALAALREGERLFLSLADKREPLSLGNLAGARSNIALALGDLGRHEDALASSEQALSAYRRLAAARPDAFRSDLANSLSNTASYLSDVGRYEDGLRLGEEALALHRQLATARPDAFRAALATSLSNTASYLCDVGRYEDGLPLDEEALVIYRELATARPDAFRSGLARSLNNTAQILAEIDRVDAALPLNEEAIDISDSLFRHSPHAVRSDLANTLANCCRLLADKGRFVEGCVAGERSWTLWTEEAARRTTAHLDFRTYAAASFARCLEGAARNAEAAVIAGQGIRLLELDLVARGRKPRPFERRYAEHLFRIAGASPQSHPQLAVALDLTTSEMPNS